jgi:excisionase family DNA binding protein
MDDILTARQVQNILKVDRITIYRMLQDGRLKGIKVGAQWRFTRQEVERLLSGEAHASTPAVEDPSPEVTPAFPTHCVQTIQDLFSAVSQISALVVDTTGEPLTQPSNPCEFCQLIQQSPNGLAACQASWREMARQALTGRKFFTCHAGMQYMAAPFTDDEKPVGFFLAGEFYWQTPNPIEESERLQRLAESSRIPLEQLQQAKRSIPVIDPSMHTRVEGWPFTAARAIQGILLERSRYMTRLQQIATLTQIP